MATTEKHRINPSPLTAFFVAQLKAPSLFLTAKTGVSQIHGMKNYP
jgi:hypothetical protein